MEHTTMELQGHRAYRLLATLTLTLAVCGCGALERRSEPTFPGTVPDSASTSTSADSAAPADASTIANVAPARKSKLRPAEAGFKFNLHVFGLSYHLDQEGTRRERLDNEVNAGLGLRYNFHDDDKGVAFVDAGFYKDSGRNWAKLAGPGYQFKLSDHWRLGATLTLLKSRTYNRGNAFITPIPLLTYDLGGSYKLGAPYNLGALKLNAVYLPRFQQNEFAVFAVYLSLPLGE